MIESTARAIHASYWSERSPEQRVDAIARGVVENWASLTHDKQIANRAQVWHIPVHLASWVPDHGLAFIVVRDVDRIVVLLTFIGVAVLWRRLTRARA